MKTSVVERESEVGGELGLHARPAAEFAKAAAGYASDIRVLKGDREVDGKSVLSLLTLDVRRGDHILLRAEGPDAVTAVEALTRLVASP